MSIASGVLTVLSALLLLAGFISLVVGFLAVPFRPIRERLSIASPISLVRLGSVLFFRGWVIFLIGRMLSASHA